MLWFFIALSAAYIENIACSESFEHTIIHVDMKGAPARPAYLKELFSTFRALGATGVLMEWEDMFPYTGPLSAIVNGNAYSMEEVEDVLQHADSLGLEMIPSVQTLGHLEWILKTQQFAPHRSDERYPFAICIGNDSAVDLIEDSLRQVLAVHSKYPLRYFHIGADEAYTLGTCAEDKAAAAQIYGGDMKKLVMRHMRRMCDVVREKGNNIKILAWFDEFRQTPSEDVKEFGLDERIEPVVWKYTQQIDKYLPEELWRNLSRSFSTVWGASAFKGADGADRQLNRVSPYLDNNRAWNVLANSLYVPLMPEFRGMLITGWQRYDHSSSLCETLPMSMSALALSIEIVNNYDVTDEAVSRIISALKCPNGTTVDQLMQTKDRCHFPGFRVRDAIRQYTDAEAYIHNSTWIRNREQGWLGETQSRLGYSNPYYTDTLIKTYSSVQNKLIRAISDMRSSMSVLFYPDVAEELIQDHVQPLLEEVSRKLSGAERVHSTRFLPPRPYFPLPPALMMEKEQKVEKPREILRARRSN